MTDPAQGLLLALDTASPTVSIALGDATGVRASATLPLRRSSEGLLAAVQDVLERGGSSLDGLDGLVVLQGPGSFTGLRIGLATVMGLHQATDLPVAVLPTLPVLASAAGVGDTDVVAAVDALRGDWYAQRFQVVDARPPRALDEAGLVAAEDLGRPGPSRVIGFGLDALETDAAIECIEPPPLAEQTLTAARHTPLAWDPARLTRPIYFRPPAVTVPQHPNPAGA